MDTTEHPVALDFLFALQSRAANEPFLPKLRAFKCGRTIPPPIPLIPLIPSLISRRTAEVHIRFCGDSPTAMVASVIIRLPMLCPDLERITLEGLPRDPVIVEAISDMLLACNRDTLEWFCVDSSLTDEAREVVFQLPNLTDLWVIIQGHSLLPPVALPNLFAIDLEYDDHLDWLQGFRGATFKNLEAAHFTSHSEQIGDFLGEFKSVALATSASATLFKFSFRTSQPWDPTYRSLLPFTQLEDLQIDFSCNNHCSSRLDDNIVIDLARAMPKLEILKLGGAPCKTGGDVTVKGLIGLACGCRHLSKLRIHFQTESLVEVVAGAEVPAPSGSGMVVRQQDCALTDLEVGEIPIQKGTANTVAVALLQIFPRLLNIEFIEKRWEDAAEIIRLTRRFSTFVQHTGKRHLSYPCYPQLHSSRQRTWYWRCARVESSIVSDPAPVIAFTF